MKKLLLTALGAFCLGSFAFAQDETKAAQKKRATPAAEARAKAKANEAELQAKRQKEKEADYLKVKQATTAPAARQNSAAAEKVQP